MDRPDRLARGNRSRSRGQLLLVAGLGIAVTMVTLAVVLNAAIYTENLATRDTVPGDQAVTFERATDEGVGGLLALVNYHDNADYATLHQHLASELRAWTAQASRHGAAYGTARGAALIGVEDGTRIVQDDHRAFTDDGGRADWRLATNVGEVRRFRMNVTRSALASGPSGAFEVVVANGSQVWRATIYDDGTNVTVALSGTAYGGDGPVYRAAGRHVEIDLTQGIVAGEERSFTFASGVTPPFDVSYRNGDEVAGRYVLFVDRPRVPLLSANPANVYHGRRSGRSPYTAPALYSANVSVAFERPDLAYESTVTVAPPRSPRGTPFSLGGGPSDRELVYVNASTGRLSSVNGSGAVTRYAATGIQAIGPKRLDLDGDDLREIPYVNASGYLKLVDERNRTQTLAAGAAGDLLAVGTWRGETDVFYVNESDSGRVYRVSPGEEPTMATITAHGGRGYKANAVAGVADFNGDGDADVVFTGTSSTMKYVDDGGIRSPNDVAADGIGAPRYFDATTGVRAPFVDESGHPSLVGATGATSQVTSETAEESPVAGVDFDETTPTLELAYVVRDTNYVTYALLNGTTVVVDPDGPADAIRADETVGVA